jgi:hypothetical protein
MYTFALQEIEEIKGRLKIFKLLVNGKCSYDEFEKEIENEGNLNSELATIYTRLHEIADCKSLPEKKFRDITPKKGNNKEYELKHITFVFICFTRKTPDILSFVVEKRELKRLI